jgi:hypothetical protein
VVDRVCSKRTGRRDLRLELGRIKSALIASNLSAFLLFAFPEALFAGEMEGSLFPYLLTLAASGGFMYSLLFASKQLVIFEKGRLVGISEHALTAFLLWFWLAGVWFVQPRVPRLAATR